MTIPAKLWQQLTEIETERCTAGMRYIAAGRPGRGSPEWEAVREAEAARNAFDRRLGSSGVEAMDTDQRAEWAYLHRQCEHRAGFGPAPALPLKHGAARLTGLSGLAAAFGAVKVKIPKFPFSGNEYGELSCWARPGGRPSACAKQGSKLADFIAKTLTPLAPAGYVVQQTSAPYMVQDQHYFGEARERLPRMALMGSLHFRIVREETATVEPRYEDFYVSFAFAGWSGPEHRGDIRWGHTFPAYPPNSPGTTEGEVAAHVYGELGDLAVALFQKAEAAGMNDAIRREQYHRKAFRW